MRLCTKGSPGVLSLDDRNNLAVKIFPCQRGKGFADRQHRNCGESDLEDLRLRAGAALPDLASEAIVTRLPPKPRSRCIISAHYAHLAYKSRGMSSRASRSGAAILCGVAARIACRASTCIGCGTQARARLRQACRSPLQARRRRQILRRHRRHNANASAIAPRLRFGLRATRRACVTGSSLALRLSPAFSMAESTRNSALSMRAHPLVLAARFGVRVLLQRPRVARMSEAISGNDPLRFSLLLPEVASLHPGSFPRSKRRMRNAPGRKLTLRNLRCGAHPAGRARLLAFHRGSSLGTHASRGATPDQVSRRWRLGMAGGLPPAPAPLQRAPRMPVIMPADMMSETARQRLSTAARGRRPRPMIRLASGPPPVPRRGLMSLSQTETMSR